jgi:hypothetical protein
MTKTVEIVSKNIIRKNDSVDIFIINFLRTLQKSGIFIPHPHLALPAKFSNCQPIATY